MAVKVFNVGDKVRLTGQFLRDTGQIAGEDGQSVWTVQAYIVGKGDRYAFVLTNEFRPDDGMYTAEEIAADPTLRYRRINAANLERCR